MQYSSMSHRRDFSFSFVKTESGDDSKSPLENIEEAVSHEKKEN